LQNDADAIAPCLTRAPLGGGIKTKYLHLATIAVAETLKDFNGCGLAGSVRTKESEDFTLFDSKIQAIDSVVWAITLAQA
jgi:hypothetical protein